MWSRQGELDKLIIDKKTELGKIPEDTCPDINKVIEELENLRVDNSKLRELGKDWYNFCDELSYETDKIIKEFEEEKEELEKEISKLKDEIESLNNRLK